jgi:hypothetical protein
MATDGFLRFARQTSFDLPVRRHEQYATFHEDDLTGHGFTIRVDLWYVRALHSEKRSKSEKGGKGRQICSTAY